MLEIKKSKKPLLSMVLCITRREEEPIAFLKSLNSYLDVIQLIIVFQPQINPKIIEFLETKKSLFHNLKIIVAEERSLSYARNCGLKLVKGDFVCFPDDDCTYDQNLLGEIIPVLFKKKNYKNFTGLCVPYPGSNLKKIYKVNYKNLLGNIISFSFFIRNPNLIKESIFFNENLGIGNFFGSAEETEYLLKVITNIYEIDVIQTTKVNHPRHFLNNPLREYNYGKGHGAIALYYIKYYPLLGLFLSIKILLLPFFRLFYFFLKFDFLKVKCSFLSILGRWIGFILYSRILFKI